MDTGDIPTLPRGVRLHFDAIRDTWVLLAPERAVTLDGIGHAILDVVDGTRSFGDITQLLAEKFNTPATQIAEDSGGFLDALRNRRFLDVKA